MTDALAPNGPAAKAYGLQHEIAEARVDIGDGKCKQDELEYEFRVCVLRTKLTLFWLYKEQAVKGGLDIKKLDSKILEPFQLFSVTSLNALLLRIDASLSYPCRFLS